MERRDAHYVANLLQSCIGKRAHLAGKLVHAYVFRIGLFTDTFLCNRLIELYSKGNNTFYARNLFDHMPHRNVYSWNGILSECCRVGDVDNARDLFARMPERNVASWNNLISAMVRGGLERQALGLYDEMICQCFLPNRFTFASVLSACSSLADAEYGRRCHGQAVKLGLQHNIFVSNALLSVYAKCGLVGDAARLLVEIPEPNEVTFTVVMGGLAQMDRVADALAMFRLMFQRGIRIDSVSLSSVLGVFAKGRFEESSACKENGGPLSKLHGEQVHGLAVKLGFENDLHLSNSLLDMYAKNGDMDSAENVFANLPKVSVISWNVMIAGYGKYHYKKAIEYLQRMQSEGFQPDEVTYINTLTACFKSQDIETGRQMFDCLAHPSVSSWNAILSGYIQIGDDKEAVKLFRDMQFRILQPDRTTLALILSTCASLSLLKAGKQVHAFSLKADFHNDIYVTSGLITMYSKCGMMDIARCIFGRMVYLDIVCWNSMIAGFSLNSLNYEALTFFGQMLKEGVAPTQFSYATILNCCAKLSSSFQGRQLHTHIAKQGYINDLFVGSALIDMYCKCGNIDEAWQFFDMMPNKNTVTWNEMIHGYAQNGQGEEAVHLYENMIGSGVKPDGITFVAVLTACSHSGLADKGVEIFDSMLRDHNVEPILDHYTCVIDVLGRAGRFHEAELLLDKMPCKNDPIVWGVLLSSCRVHANVSLAERAATELIRVDPQNSAPYVLLAHVYSSLGRWDDARAIRELMSDKHIDKNPGYSWTEPKSGMQYLVGDNDTRLFDGELVIAHQT